MKKILYFDCTSGISGDMTLGALLHLGADPERLKEELAKLDVGGYTLIPAPGTKSGIAGISLDVRLEAATPHGHDPHGHDHAGPIVHDHSSYRSIDTLIAGSGLSPRAGDMARSMMQAIAEAEAAVHNMPLEDVIFHEVGAVDSIVDIVGTAICIDLLDIDEIWCSPVHDGSGTIECRHGLIPVPVPAVMEMLKGSRIRIVMEPDVKTEMVTPTGLGILKGLNAFCGSLPELSVLGVGYGFGKRDTGRFNAVRVIMGLRPEDGPKQP